MSAKTPHVIAATARLTQPAIAGARLRPVQLGRRNSAEVEVLSGLGSRDSVILYPTDNVRDGVRTTAE